MDDPFEQARRLSALLRGPIDELQEQMKRQREMLDSIGRPLKFPAGLRLPDPLGDISRLFPSSQLIAAKMNEPLFKLSSDLAAIGSSRQLESMRALVGAASEAQRTLGVHREFWKSQSAEIGAGISRALSQLDLAGKRLRFPVIDFAQLATRNFLEAAVLSRPETGFASDFFPRVAALTEAPNEAEAVEAVDNFATWFTDEASKQKIGLGEFLAFLGIFISFLLFALDRIHSDELSAEAMRQAAQSEQRLLAAIQRLEPQPLQGRVVLVTRNCHLRTRADVASSSVRILRVGALLEVTGSAENWLSVRVFNVETGMTEEGWVYSRLVKAIEFDE